MIKEAIGKVVLKRDLTEGEMEEVMEEITKRSASNPQITSFITALRMKGETPEEITAAMTRILSDREVRDSMIDMGYIQAAKFSWKAMAIHVLAIYREFGASKY